MKHEKLWRLFSNVALRVDEINADLYECRDRLRELQPKRRGALLLYLTEHGGGCMGCPHPDWKQYNRNTSAPGPGQNALYRIRRHPTKKIYRKKEFYDNYEQVLATVNRVYDQNLEKKSYSPILGHIRRALAVRVDVSAINDASDMRGKITTLLKLLSDRFETIDSVLDHGKQKLESLQDEVPGKIIYTPRLCGKKGCQFCPHPQWSAVQYKKRSKLKFQRVVVAMPLKYLPLKGPLIPVKEDVGFIVREMQKHIREREKYIELTGQLSRTYQGRWVIT